MNKITEYVITENEEYHSTHSSLRKARKIYRSLINIREVEGETCNIKILKKTVTYKIIDDFHTTSNISTIGDFFEKDISEGKL